MKLPISVEQYPLETPAIFTARLALANGVRSPILFCTDTGLDWKGIQYGETDALRALSEVSDADYEKLVANCCRDFVHTDKAGACNRYSTFRGVVVPRSFFPVNNFNICPKCIEDDRGYNVHWGFKAMTSCPIHKLILINPASNPNSQYAYVRIAKLIINGVDLSEFKLIETQHGIFDQFVEDRLLGRASAGWLDNIPIHAVAHMSEVIGSTIWSLDNARFTRLMSARIVD